MTSLFPIIPGDKIQVLYSPTGCVDANSCYEITVRIQPIPVATVIPYIPLSLTLPAFATTLPNESMQSTNKDGVANPVCS